MPQNHAMPQDCTRYDEEDVEDCQYTDKDLVSPLPKLQLFVVLLMQLAEPVTASFVYPFVNRLVVLSGVTKGDDRKAGYYVGLLVCFPRLAARLPISYRVARLRIQPSLEQSA